MSAIKTTRIRSGLYQAIVCGVRYELKLFPKATNDAGSPRDFWTLTPFIDDVPDECDYAATKAGCIRALEAIQRVTEGRAEGQEAI